MYSTSCPGCGAPVEYRSAAAVVAVCPYCNSTLLRDGEAVRDIGKMATVIEDFSPLQITTSGVFSGRHFAIVGRIQLRYEAGLWSEWYVLFDDGGAGWLSDASGQYVLTVEAAAPPDAPEFTRVRPGTQWHWDGQTFMASDVRKARCVAGEGELPFVVGRGWQAAVADFRQAARFLTLDYSDGQLRLYHGRAVGLDELACQLLRSPEQIEASAGRLRGAVASLSCPACGASIPYAAGITNYLVCPSCGTKSDCSAGQALALEKAGEHAQVKSTLALGECGRFDGDDYRVIGMCRCRTVDEDERWTEYLLYHHRKGFLWLVEGEHGWERVDVLNVWPDTRSGSGVTLEGAAYTRLVDYVSEVEYVAGAFNWQVRLGEQTRITDFKRGQSKLSMELSEDELLWTRSQPISTAVLSTGFGREIAAPASSPLSPGDESATGRPLSGTAKFFTYVLLILNVPAALSSGGRGLVIVVLALLALWVPVLLGPRAEADED